MSLRRRIAFTAAGAVAVAFVLGAIVAYFVVRGALHEQIDQSLTARATFSVPAPPGEAGQSEPLQGPVVFRQMIVGDRVIGGASGPEGRLGDPAAIKAVAEGKRPPFLADAHVDGVDVRVFTARGPDGAAVQVFRSLTE